MINRLSPLVLLAMTACGSTPPGRDRFQERLVGTIPAGVNDWWVSISADGSTTAYVDRRDSQAFLVVGSRRYGPYS